MSLQTIFLGNPKAPFSREILYRSVTNNCRGNDRIRKSPLAASGDGADGGSSHTWMTSLDRRLMNFRLWPTGPSDESQSHLSGQQALLSSGVTCQEARSNPCAS